MTNRLPIIALQKALFTLLTAHLTSPAIPVYDDVPKDAALPYVTFGTATWRPTGTKDADIGDVGQPIEIWSEYKGKAEVIGIADKIVNILAKYAVNLSADEFMVIKSEIEGFEAPPKDDSGYHGTLSLFYKIQNIKREV